MGKPDDIQAGDEISAKWHMEVRDAAFGTGSGNAPGASGPGGFAYRPPDTESEPYAVAQDDWEENDGDPKVSVKTCDASGSNVRGYAFDVYLPRRRALPNDPDPDVYEDDIIRYGWDHEGRRICISPQPNTVIFGKLDGALEQGSSQTLTVWAGTSLAETDNTVTVYDWFLEAGAQLPSGTKCVATRYHGRWYVTTAECPAE